MEDCHIASGINLNGYRAIKSQGEMIYLHRIIWEENFGLIKKGMFIDHKCRNRSCININHLRLVTPRINSIENSVGITAINYLKKKCKRGHLLPISRNNSGKRVCKICKSLLNKIRMLNPITKEKCRENYRRYYMKKRLIGIGG